MWMQESYDRSMVEVNKTVSPVIVLDFLTYAMYKVGKYVTNRLSNPCHFDESTHCSWKVLVGWQILHWSLGILKGIGIWEQFHIFSNTFKSILNEISKTCIQFAFSLS